MKSALRRARWGILGLTAVVLFAGGGWRWGSRSAPDGNVYERARLFETVRTMIHRQYIDSLGEGALYQAAAEALVVSLGDPYAELLTGESYRQHRLQMAGNEVGDISPEIGKKGATRRVDQHTVHVSASSPGVLLGDGIGYVALHRMSNGAADELRAEIDTLRRQGMTRLVLDLRLNPGGLISQGVKTASLFLATDDTVATSIGRDSTRPRTYLASALTHWRDMPLIVLVNRGTASSAELVASALQDHDRAVIVGTPTYGKGVLQTTYPIGDSAAIKLTTARWQAPSGRSVQRLRVDSTTGTWHQVIDTTTTFRTAMGRLVPAHQGVVPDLLVRSNVRYETERAFLSTLGSDVAVFRHELGLLAQELATKLRGRAEHFEVTGGMRETLFDRLVAQGIEMPRDIYRGAALYIDDQLDYEVTRLALGPAAEARRRIRSDRQLQAALTVLKRASTPQQALALAAITRRAAR